MSDTYSRKALESIIFQDGQSWNDDPFYIVAKFNLACIACSSCETQPEIIGKLSTDIFASDQWCLSVSEWLRRSGWKVTPPSDGKFAVDILCPACAK